MALGKLFTTLALTGALSLSPALAERGVTDDEIIIGSHSALSGPAAIWGVSSINTARLMFDEVNAKGGIHGRKIKFIVEDHQYQVPLAVKAVNKLINRDKVFAIHMALGTPHNNAVMRRVLSAGIPNLFPLTGAISMTEPFHKLKFQALSTYNQQTRAAIRYFHKNKGHERICAFYQDTDYGQEIKDAIDQEIAALGLTLVAETKHKSTETEFVGGMTSLKNANCDLIVFGTIIQDTIIAYATARKLGITADIVGSQASNDNVVAAAKGGATEGYFVAGATRAMYEDTATPAQMEFMKKYKARYGEFPGVGTLYSYLPTKVLIEALEKAGRDLTVDKLVAALETVKDYDDGLGTPLHTFTETDHSGSDGVNLDIVRDGKLRPVADRIDLQ
ncbi:MAG: ABC transporter substrate-binding protein [PS1 clade bacterium]|uniref:ABC transporter substrate-binding protein n=1 Tax=PS1 clade bacterium TaxID=2175152 RepID=A0A937L6Q3_9PROT|nr:ABC transporter substrate-binding protein [PS1 clade bacterium]